MIHLTLSLALAASASCLEPSGTRITASDMGAAVPAFARLAGDLVLGYAPQPGYARTFAPAELRQWSSRHGLEADIQDSVCFRWELSALDPEAARAAMLAQLPDGAQVQILDTGSYDVPKGELVFPPSGLRKAQGREAPVWHGFVRYAADSKFEVWARVDVRVPYRRVVSTQALKPGSPVDSSWLRIETGYGAPQASDIADEIEKVAGRTPRRLIPAGAVVPSSALEKPAAVRRGDPLRVSVVSGKARIAFDGIAEGTAATGNSVAVRISDSGRIVRARVKSPTEAVLDLTQGEGK